LVIPGVGLSLLLACCYGSVQVLIIFSQVSITHLTMQFVGLSTLVLLFGALAPAQGVLTSMAATIQARSMMHTQAHQRVELTAHSMHALELALQIPKNASKAKEEKVLKTLESQVATLEANVANITKLDKMEKSGEEQQRMQKLKSSMKPADQAMLAKMDEWGNRMNHKAKLGATDVISKLKNAIHLIKKGALNGNKEAASGLSDVLAKMGAMAGQSTGKFLH